MMRGKMKDKLVKIISIIITTILVIVSCIFTVKNILFFDILVVGDSMVSTLKEGEIGIALKDEFISSIDRKDIIIFERDDKEIIKRVIGKPLDHISITREGIYVNGELIEESYISSENLTCTYLLNGEYNDVILQEDEYYVLGDNRIVSYDSRYYGPIKEKDITGKLEVIYSKGQCSDSTCSEIKGQKFVPFRWF